MEASTELAQMDSAAVEAALTTGAALPEVENAEDVAQQIAARILSANTVDEVFATFETVSGEDLLDIPLEIHAVRWNRSTFEDGPTLYAVIDAINLLDGERIVATTGGRSVMAALFQLQRLGELPVHAKLVQSKSPTAAGFRPLRLARV